MGTVALSHTLGASQSLTCFTLWLWLSLPDNDRACGLQICTCSTHDGPEGPAAGWDWGSVGRVPVQHLQGPGFDLQHHTNWIWWHMLAIPAPASQVKNRGSKVQGHSQPHGEFEVSLEKTLSNKREGQREGWSGGEGRQGELRKMLYVLKYLKIEKRWRHIQLISWTKCNIQIFTFNA